MASGHPMLYTHLEHQLPLKDHEVEGADNIGTWPENHDQSMHIFFVAASLCKTHQASSVESPTCASAASG